MLKYGWVHVGFFMERAVVMVADPAEMKQLLSVAFENVDRSTMEQLRLSELLGDGLILISNGPRWRQARPTRRRGQHPCGWAAFGQADLGPTLPWHACSGACACLCVLDYGTFASSASSHSRRSTPTACDRPPRR